MLRAIAFTKTLREGNGKRTFYWNGLRNIFSKVAHTIIFIDTIIAYYLGHGLFFKLHCFIVKLVWKILNQDKFKPQHTYFLGWHWCKILKINTTPPFPTALPPKKRKRNMANAKLILIISPPKCKLVGLYLHSSCSSLLTIIPRACVGYEMVESQLSTTCLVGYNCLISNKHEWNNNCFIKNIQRNTSKLATKIAKKRRTGNILVVTGIWAHIP